MSATSKHDRPRFERTLRCGGFIKSQSILLAVVSMAASAFAQSDDAAFLAQFEKTFEQGEAVEAANFVPATLMSGKLHRVHTLAGNDGLVNTYIVDAHGATVEVAGTSALAVYISELYAIDYLRGVSRSEEFGKALAQSGKAKLESAAGMVRDPIGTIKNVPKGASRFFGRVGEGLKGKKSESEGGALAGITGVNQAKAKIAAKLGVSPYSTNEELQRELTEVARASAGGGLVVSAATAAVGGGGGDVLTLFSMNKTIQDTLVSSTPEDLRALNRKKLLALKVERTLADEFLMHPWFSPWHETITTDALATIGVNPSAFLTDAVRALTSEDALYFQRIAQILARYHATAAPLRSIRFEGGIITALDKDGTLVVPVSLDYGIWAERAARRVEEFSAIDKSRDGIKALALWTDGRLSERLCAELKARHIDYRADALAGQ